MQMISLVQDKIATKIKIEMVCNQRNAHRHRIQSAHNAHYILRVQRVEKTCRASGLTRVSPGIFRNAAERKSCPIIRLSVTDV